MSEEKPKEQEEMNERAILSAIDKLDKVSDLKAYAEDLKAKGLAGDKDAARLYVTMWFMHQMQKSVNGDRDDSKTNFAKMFD